MPDLGVRLLLLLGKTVPLPAPFAVMDAFTELEVTNNDRERDGFQIKFTLGKDTPLDYSLLKSGALDAGNRIVISVIFNFAPQVLIDGVITDHQITPSNKPGESTLAVTGEDISVKLDLEERDETYPNQPDSIIVTKILANYAALGIIPKVTPTTDVPLQTERIPSQQKTDLVYIRELAQRNGFVFFVEPLTPGTSTAYWGLDNRLGLPQPALSMNMAGQTNVDSPMNFRFNALGPVAPEIKIVEPNTKITIPIPVPSGLRPPLSRRPAPALRRTLPRNTANQNSIQAGLRGVASTSQASDAVSASGEIDAVRYGTVLRARRLVGVRGTGETYGGMYYVKQVTHRIKRGEYKQSYSLTREGLGSITPVVRP